MKKLTTTLIVSTALMGAASVHAAGLDQSSAQPQRVAQVNTGAQPGTDSKGNLDYQPGGSGSPNLQTREEVVQDRDATKASGDMQQKGELTKPNQREQSTSNTREGVEAERDAAKAAGQTSKGNLDYPAPAPKQ